MTTEEFFELILNSAHRLGLCKNITSNHDISELSRIENASFEELMNALLGSSDFNNYQSLDQMRLGFMWSFFAGLGSYYFYKNGSPLQFYEKSYIPKLIKAQTVSNMDDYVLSLYKIEDSSEEGNAIRAMLEFSCVSVLKNISEGNDKTAFTKAFPAAFRFGVSYGISKIGAPESKFVSNDNSTRNDDYPKIDGIIKCPSCDNLISSYPCKYCKYDGKGFVNSYRFDYKHHKEQVLEANKCFRNDIIKIFVFVAIIIAIIILAYNADNGPRSSESVSYENTPRATTSHTTVAPYERATAAPTIPPTPTPIPLPKPNNGQILKYPSYKCQAELLVDATNNSSALGYYVYLDEVSTPGKDISLFVRGGSKASIDVPLGTYEMYYCAGENWYGTQDKFGADTMYSKMSDTLEFYIEGNKIVGNSITLYTKYGGNISTQNISESQFPD